MITVDSLSELVDSMTVHRILKNIPIFTQYWKMAPKIVFLNPPPNIPFQLRKTIASLDIVGIHIYQPIFNTPFISYYQVIKKNYP